MGADIHMLIQQKQPDGSYTTIIQDALYLGSSECYQFNTFIEDIRTVGIPDDMQPNVDENNVYSEYRFPKFFLGDWGVGWYYLPDFIDLDSERVEWTRHMITETTDSSINISFPALEDIEYNFEDWIYYYQITLGRMFNSHNTKADHYRVVVGFDN